MILNVDTAHQCNLFSSNQVSLQDFLYRYQDVSWCINTLRPRQNGRHFVDGTFKSIFMNENVWIQIKISLKFVPKGPINNNPAFVQIMAWRRSGDKPLSEPMMVSLVTHLCVTRPQWVKSMPWLMMLHLALPGHQQPWLLWSHNERKGVSNPRHLDCLLNHSFKRRSKKTSKLCVIGLCVGNPPVTSGFPSQMASNMENVFSWWHQHDGLWQCKVYYNYIFHDEGYQLPMNQNQNQKTFIRYIYSKAKVIT